MEDFQFNENEGLKLRINENPQPIDFVEIYFTETLLQLIVTETNRYPKQYVEANSKKADSSYIVRWAPVACSEMKVFLGLLLLTGIIQKGSLNTYWSTEELIQTPMFSIVMTSDRFLLILRFLYFNNSNDPNYNLRDKNKDHLHKIRPFLDMSCEWFRQVYLPGKQLSDDESLIFFKGRLHFKQYIKTKRSRFGIKLYELTTSNGITIGLLVYPGKGMFSGEDLNSDMPTTECIPSVLMEAFLGKGHILCTDNYYTSPSLASFFLDNQTYLCGTIRPNRRHYPKELVNTNLQRSEPVFYKAKNGKAMLACKYRSHKDMNSKQPKIVHMLSTWS